MIIICAWCQENLGEKEPMENKNITHGMCEKCKKQYDTEIANMKEVVQIEKRCQID